MPATLRIIVMRLSMPDSTASTSLPLTKMDSPARRSSVIFLPASARYTRPCPSTFISCMPSPLTAFFNRLPSPCSSTP